VGRVIPALVRGNLSALRCDRGALGLVAVGSLVLAVAATMGAFGSFHLFFFVSFVLVPIFGTAIGAVGISGERSSGYAAVLHTAPVTPGAYFAAKWLTAYLWACLALLLTLPYGLLFALYLGPEFLARFLPWIPVGLLLAAFGTSLGVLLSVLVGRRGVVPSAFAGIGVALAVSLVPLLLLALPTDLKEAAAPLLRLSPLTNLLEPRGNLVARTLATEEGWKGYGTIAGHAVLYAGLAYALYTRLQNAEGWDAPRRHVAGALLVGVALVVVPVFAIGGDPLGLETPDAGPSPGDVRSGPSFHVGAWFLPADPGASLEEGPQPVALVAHQAIPVRLVVRPEGSFGAEAPQAGPGAASGALTGVVITFLAQPEGVVEMSPAEVRVGTWPTEPCPGVPKERGCTRLAPMTFDLTATLRSRDNFQPGLIGGNVLLRIATDQGDLTTYPQQQFTLDPVGYPWWGAFAAWAAVVGGFLALHLERQRHLRRKAPAAVLRRAPAATPTQAPSPGAGAPPAGPARRR
jgi:ABC-type transport system involved in multi-copper enzyme maturation permease subunit